MDELSWTELEQPYDSGVWRVPEPFRDRKLTLAMLDRIVGDFDQGCMDGRKSFIEFVAKAIVDGDEWWGEVKRQEEARREQRRHEEGYAQSRAEDAVRLTLRRYRTDFEDGYIPAEACDNNYCMNDICVTRRAWFLWHQERREDG